MKKTFTLLSIIFALYAKAQIINPGFETWTTDAYAAPAMNPNSGNGTTGWWEYNVFNSSFVGSSPVSVFRCDTAHSGSYSARIETVVYTNTSWNIYKSWGVPYIGHNYADTLGIVFNGNVNETGATYRPGFPFTQKIHSFSFYYQYKPSGIDTAECRVSLIKSGAFVAGGIFKTHVTTGPVWQQAVINMVYADTLTPDTMYVLFSSSSLDRAPKPGSMFWIDDVSTSLTTGVQELKNLADQVTVYPNPGRDHFKIETQRTLHNAQCVIYDVTGKIALSLFIPDTGKNGFTVDTGSLPEGVYNLGIRCEEGLLNKRLVIMH